MAKVTNNSKARQGIRVGAVLHWVLPGETLDKPMTTDDVARAKRHAFLEVEGEGEKVEENRKLPGLTGKSKDDLLAIAAAEGVTTFSADDGAAKLLAEGTRNDIVAAIEAAREAG